jgi:hypothetical protein
MRLLERSHAADTRAMEQIVLPAHWMKAMFFASLPSEGRSNLPPVGPCGLASRSNSTLVITLAKRS